METNKGNDRNVVWEHRNGGGRFMTNYSKGETYEDNEHHIVVAENISYENGLLLCEQRQENSIAAFMNDLPDFLKNPDLSKIIRGIK